MMFGTREPFRYGECSACGLLWLLDVPADLSAHYPDDYYAYGVVQTRQTDALRRWMLRAKARHLLGRLQPAGALLQRFRPHALTQALGWLRRAGVGLHSRILDVGCGQGHLIHALAETGFRHVEGADPFISADIAYPNGTRVARCAVEDLDGAYDLVMCHHAFEHMDAPRDRLAAMAARLAPGGTLLIRIPLADSHAWEHYGTDWVQLDAPRHLFLHTRRSMAHLEREVGLREVEVVYDGTGFGYWGSELYRRDLPLRPPGGGNSGPGRLGLTPDQMQSFDRKAAYANRSERGDQAAFYLRNAALAA